MNHKILNRAGQRQAPHVQGALRKAMFFAALIGLSLLVALPASAATRTWTGANTNWNDAANWVGGIVPTNGDAVVIPNTAIRPSMPAGTYPADGGSFLSFELQAGATNTCLGDTNAVNAASGGTVAKPHGTGVAINCQSALISGTMTANSRGFRGAFYGYGGPGNSYWGGSHGGMTMSKYAADPSSRYGSLTQPTALGSGDYNAAPGGGAIKIAVTDTLTVNGSVTANGQGDGAGGGSGGSVWLICDQLAGTGTISALGGSSFRPDENASGGGGRISIECQSNAFQGAIKVGGGAGPGQGIGAGGKAQPGTLWFPKWLTGREGTRANPADLWLPGPEYGVRYWFPDSTVTQYWNVSMTNSWLELYAGSAVISNLCITNGCFWVNETSLSNLTVYGNIYLTNTTLYLPAYGVYDLSGDFVVADTNTVVYALGDTNAVNADSGGTVSIKHGIGLGVSCQNATINGSINGTGRGFREPGWLGPGSGGYYSDSLGAYVGGAYGGQSGGSSLPAYGSMTRPTALGSAAGVTADSAESQYPKGGGAVQIRALGTLTLNGTISVNGISSYQNCIGSSGGSVWLQAGAFAGTGAICAQGSDTPYDWIATGGGGGRIAIEYRSWTYTGSNSVKGGETVKATLPDGKTGTVFLCQSPWLGTTTTNGVNGRRLDTQFSVNSNNVRITRAITRFDTSIQWSDYSSDVSGSFVVTNNAIYTISGLNPSSGYAVYRDGAILFGGKLLTSTNGVLTFTNTLDMQRNFFLTPDTPSIIIQPQSLTNNPGQTATFSIQADGAAPLSYQWQKWGTNLAGATSTNYTIGSVQESDEGSYRCIVTNMAGMATSAWAYLVVNDPSAALQFSASSTSVNENAGSVTLTVTRTGGSSGAASVNYSTADGTALAGTDYVTTNGTLAWLDGNADSKTITVPIINRSGLQAKCSFTVGLSGASGASLGLPTTNTVMISDESDVFSNLGDGNSYTTGFSFDLWTQDYLALGFTVSSGKSYVLKELRVAVCNPLNNTGIGIVDFFLMTDNNGVPGTVIEAFFVDIPGHFWQGVMTMTSITKPVLYAGSKYWVAAKQRSASSELGWHFGMFDGQGTCMRSTAGGGWTVWNGYNGGRPALRVLGEVVNVNVPPVITGNPQSQTNNPGSSVTFSLAVTGTVPLIYQWQKNSTNIGGATATNYTIASVQQSDEGMYRCVVTNMAGMATSAWAYLVVNDPSAAPTGLIASDGDYTNKVALNWNVASGATGYQIFRHTINDSASADQIGIATSTTYDDTRAVAGTTYYYWVKATNAAGVSGFSASDVGYLGAVAATLAAPMRLSASDGTYSNLVRVTWNAVAGALYYELWRNTSNNSVSASVLARTTNSVIYDDATVMVGVSYCYFVKAKNAQTTSAFSDPDSGYAALNAVSGYANLEVSDVILLPTTLSVGGHPGAAGIQLMNWGPSDMTTPNTRVILDFFLSKNTMVGDKDDLWLGDYKTDVTLSAGSYTFVAVTASAREGFTVPSGAVGTNYVFARARHTYPSTLVDSDESNNHAMRSGTITVTGSNDVPSAGYHLINDYDGDGKSDLALYKEVTGEWQIMLSGASYAPARFVLGGKDYRPVIADYDGDGKADPAVCNQKTGEWKAVLSASGSSMMTFTFGGHTDMPVPIDYDRDGKADPAIYQQSGAWVMLLSGSDYAVQTMLLGGNNYVPVPADYDGDGISDLAVYRSSTGDWMLKLSTLDYWTMEIRFGGSGAIPVPADYDGDGKADMAVYKESSGEWSVMMSRLNYLTAGATFGGQGWVPVAADYDGDGKQDLAIYNDDHHLLKVLMSGSYYRLITLDVGGRGYEPVGWPR